MSIFGSSIIEGTDNFEIDEVTNAIIESYICEDIMALSESEFEEYKQSDEYKALVEAGIIGKGTFVRLSRKDDLRRRKRLAALQIGAQKNDPLVKALAKIRVKEREIMNKLETKYGNMAERQQRVAQREYIKKVPKLRKQGVKTLTV